MKQKNYVILLNDKLAKHYEKSAVLDKCFRNGIPERYLNKPHQIGVGLAHLYTV